jgi:hypothetical protein
MADWEEIKRLAADFQRTQTSDTLQRISERNCIDIVKKLTDLKLIELIYTCDGKEFLTPNHLAKEIEDEIYVNGGRVHLHDLATALNVDYQHVENTSKKIAAEKPGEYNLILGQIIHSNYKTTLEKQIFDTMIATGQLSIAEFAKSIDLPSEFLSTLVKELLPNIMDDFVVSQDEKTYYTTDMMDRYKSTIAGTLTAISKPTTIASIMKKLDIPERLFMPIVDGLIKEGRIDASVENRLFIPSIYAKEQNDWVDKFYSSNSYIEYDVLLRKDIKQPKAFLKKRFPEGMQLKTCFISPALISQVEALIEDCITTNGLIDISSTLPPSIQPEDIEQMLNEIFKKNQQLAASCMVLKQTHVCSLGYLATCRGSFESFMESRAKEHLQQGKLFKYFLGTNVKADATKNNQEQVQKAPSKQSDETRSGEDKQEEASADKKDADITDCGNKDEQKGEETSNTKKKQAEPIELTAEDLKREKRQKKGKGADRGEPEESEDELNNPGSKKSKSRKSGGGAQGREIKQKSTKKKYFVGKGGKHNVNDDSDSDSKATSSSKHPRSNKGRAARRGASPEPRNSSAKGVSDGNKGKQSGPSEKEPLVFLGSEELIEKLKEQTHDSGEIDLEIFESIANMLEADLNKKYESCARKVLDEYLKSVEKAAENSAEKEAESGKDLEIDLVE